MVTYSDTGLIRPGADERKFTVLEASRLLNVHPLTVYRKIWDGDLPTLVRPPEGQYAISEKDLLLYALNTRRLTRRRRGFSYPTRGVA